MPKVAAASFFADCHGIYASADRVAARDASIGALVADCCFLCDRFEIENRLATPARDPAWQVALDRSSINDPRWLMTSTVVRRNVMEYRDHEFRYDADNLLEPDAESVRQLSEGKQYRQQRSVRPKRRKAPKATHPGCGMGARRNRRWTW